VDEPNILERIDALVEEEHQLRGGKPDLDAEQRRERLRQLEQTLDQCWDLLRQRRARIQAGQNPDEAKTRSVDEVGRYLQ
jgi:Protein of unknown function (DUF2630)